MNKERIAIIEGIRTPIGKANGLLKSFSVVDLGVNVVREVIEKSGLSRKEIDEVIIGNVSQPCEAANVARVIALKAGIPIDVPAYTVHRNCASGMQSITSGAEKILTGQADIVIAGGVESMSNIPLLYNKKMVELFSLLSNKKIPKSRKIKGILKSTISLEYLKPIVAILLGLKDPICNLSMGHTAEELAKEFKISREEQDRFACLSHEKAIKAESDGIFKEEIHPIYLKEMLEKDESPRKNQTVKALSKLKPYFDRKNGTITVGNACSINDGAAAVILMSEKMAKKRNLKPLGFLSDYAYAGLEGKRMGLGPVYATGKLVHKSKLNLKSIDLIEINEAFAAQVIANEKAFSSMEFAKKYLNLSKAIGEIDPEKLNVNGGAIAIGHPVGMTGTRIVITLLKELARRKKKRGLASLCIGGGQGAALILERN